MSLLLECLKSFIPTYSNSFYFLMISIKSFRITYKIFWSYSSHFHNSSKILNYLVTNTTSSFFLSLKINWIYFLLTLDIIIFLGTVVALDCVLYIRCHTTKGNLHSSSHNQSNVNTSSNRSGFFVHLHVGTLSGLDFQGSCICCHNCYEFKYAYYQLSIENTVYLKLCTTCQS